MTVISSSLAFSTATPSTSPTKLLFSGTLENCQNFPAVPAAVGPLEHLVARPAENLGFAVLEQTSRAVVPPDDLPVGGDRHHAVGRPGQQLDYIDGARSQLLARYDDHCDSFRNRARTARESTKSTKRNPFFPGRITVSCGASASRKLMRPPD